MNKDLIAIFEYMEREKGIKREILVKAIKESLLMAATKSVQGSSNVSVDIDPKNGDIEVYCEKEIVEIVENQASEISLKDAQKLDPDCEIGQFIDSLETPANFGRIAAQKARQIISQKLRSAERDVIYEQYRHRIGEIVSGTVKRISRGSTLIIDLGKVEAIMPRDEFPRNERYNMGDKINALLLDVCDTENGGAEVLLSRSSEKIVEKLFNQEIPELHDGIIEIKAIVREAGYRTKVAVISKDSKIDPVGACVGVRGNRIKNVLHEIGNEKIDIIPFTENIPEYLQNILDPIEAKRMFQDPENKLISLAVIDEDFAKVIGRHGMNLRLMKRLLHCDIEVQKFSEYQKRQVVMKAELLDSNLPWLDEKIELDGFNTLILENLYADGFISPRKVLEAETATLASVPGLSLDLADEIIEQLIQQGK